MPGAPTAGKEIASSSSRPWIDWMSYPHTPVIASDPWLFPVDGSNRHDQVRSTIRASGTRVDEELPRSSVMETQHE